MNILKGDLVKLALQGEFEIIIHGCNCFCTMGAGIAKTIKNKFPEAYQSDLKTEKGAKSKLGTFSMSEVVVQGKKLIIINAYTQFNYRGRGVKVNYEAIRNVFKEIKRNFSGKTIGYPAIGAGLAGGDWNIISTIINEELQGEEHTFVEFLKE